MQDLRLSIPARNILDNSSSFAPVRATEVDSSFTWLTVMLIFKGKFFKTTAARVLLVVSVAFVSRTVGIDIIITTTRFSWRQKQGARASADKLQFGLDDNKHRIPSTLDQF